MLLFEKMYLYMQRKTIWFVKPKNHKTSYYYGMGLLVDMNLLMGLQIFYAFTHITWQDARINWLLDGKASTASDTYMHTIIW